MISIVIADDHKVVRQGLKMLLETQQDFRLVGEASDGLEAIALVEKVRPAVLLLDLMMPVLHGLEVIRRLKRKKANVKILVLSMSNDEPSVVETLRHGADGYVFKSGGSSELVQAIRHVSNGQNHCASQISRQAASARKSPEAIKGLYETLSERERTVMQLTAEGNSNAQIAGRLFISPRTAETHRRNILRKLHLHSQTELVRFAIRKKIIAA